MATGLGWTFEAIDRLTLHEAEDFFDYWREWPPTNELAAIYLGWEKPLTTEEKIAAGAMSGLDFMEHFKKTGGKVN